MVSNEMVKKDFLIGDVVMLRYPHDEVLGEVIAKTTHGVDMDKKQWVYKIQWLDPNYRNGSSWERRTVLKFFSRSPV